MLGLCLKLKFRPTRNFECLFSISIQMNGEWFEFQSTWHIQSQAISENDQTSLKKIENPKLRGCLNFVILSYSGLFLALNGLKLGWFLFWSLMCWCYWNRNDYEIFKSYLSDPDISIRKHIEKRTHPYGSRWIAGGIRRNFGKPFRSGQKSLSRYIIIRIIWSCIRIHHE